jgi:hypothetical protein
MRTLRLFVTCGLLVSAVLSIGLVRGGDKKKPKNDMCAAGNAQSICSPENTCGSATSPCQVDIRRDGGGDSASATPAISGAKSNAPFCVKAGTTITFASKSKDTGFVLDFGNSSPFTTAVILGGADRPVSVVAEKPGCYTYSIGACTAGTVYGMCGEDAAQFVVSAK